MVAARCFSMTCQLIGLSLLTTMTQALQFHAVSLSLFSFFFLILMTSVMTSGIFTMWIVFWLFTYVIFILIVRALFIHPVHRRISSSGSKIIAACFCICSICCIFTLVVLKSDFCTCSNISSKTLEGREPGDPCQGTCRLRSAGYLTVVASGLWLVAAATVVQFGVQPPIICQEGTSMEIFGHYPRNSLISRAMSLKQRMATRVKRTAAYVSKVGRSTVDSVDDVETEDDQEHEPEDPRTSCQKACWDFRVTPRSRKEKRAFWCFRGMLGVLIGTYTFLVSILIGTRVESTNAAKAPDTSMNFITDVVCSFDALDPFQPFKTFLTKEASVAAGYQVAHCGECGDCSNPYDIQKYVETRETIAKSAKNCGATTVFKGYDDLVQCLEDQIGFQQKCTECWADNMITTAEKCMFTCMLTLFTGFMSNNNVPGAGDEGWLNQCLFCDEKMSGPAFVTCSGVARRRLGIVSEIERNPEEQCRNMDVVWVDVDWSSVFPENEEYFDISI